MNSLDKITSSNWERKKNRLDEYNFKPTDVMQGMLSFKKRPYNLKDFPFWVDIFNDIRFSKNVNQLYRKFVLMFSRQVAKSTGIGALAQRFSLTYQNFVSIIAQPTDVQISRFSVDVLKRFNDDSIVSSDWFFDRSKNQRQVKNMSYSTGSRIVLANIYASVLSTRGIPGDAVFLDEYQDIPAKNATVVMGSLGFSPYKFQIRSGTPKEPENDLQIQFDASTQNEWMIKCEGCNYWNGPLGSDGSTNKIINIGKKGLICSKCGKRLNPRKGRWVTGYRGRAVQGYHVNELGRPRDIEEATSWDELIYKIENDPIDTVFNEVLGLSYTGGAKPISKTLIQRLCKSYVYIESEKEAVKASKKYDYIFAGLDWAMNTSGDPSTRKNIMSYTMLVIGAWDITERKYKILFARRYFGELGFDGNNPSDVLVDIIKWLKAFNVQRLGADYGVGNKENTRLIQELGVERVCQIQYVSTNDIISTYRPLENKYISPKTYLMDLVVNLLQGHKYEFAKMEGETSEYVNDMTTIYRAYTQLRAYIYKKSSPDDFMQCLTTMNVARMLRFNDPEFRYIMKHQ